MILENAPGGDSCAQWPMENSMMSNGIPITTIATK